MISLTNLTAVEASPHLWMINVCRNSCAFCQSLAPRWERLADTLRNEVQPRLPSAVPQVLTTGPAVAGLRGLLGR